MIFFSLISILVYKEFLTTFRNGNVTPFLKLSFVAFLEMRGISGQCVMWLHLRPVCDVAVEASQVLKAWGPERPGPHGVGVVLLKMSGAQGTCWCREGLENKIKQANIVGKTVHRNQFNYFIIYKEETPHKNVRRK